MSLLGKSDDGRIRIRCPECGKKLKLPAGLPGKIFRCPICAASIIAPLETASAAGQKTKEDDLIALRRMGWTPNLMQVERYKSVENLGNVLGREYVDIAQSCAKILANTNYKDADAAERVAVLVREKMAKLRDYAVKQAMDLEREIEELHRNPMKNQFHHQEKIAAKQRERRDFGIFLKVVANITLPETTTPGTPDETSPTT
jgi:hypothetical protein